MNASLNSVSLSNIILLRPVLGVLTFPIILLRGVGTSNAQDRRLEADIASDFGMVLRRPVPGVLTFLLTLVR